jgi:hypothetical protein
METDQNFIEEIRNAVEDGRLEITQWEEEFLESVGELDATRSLTKRQRETLDRIHERIRLW